MVMEHVEELDHLMGEGVPLLRLAYCPYIPPAEEAQHLVQSGVGGLHPTNVNVSSACKHAST